ncbi:MAG: glutaredoxin family protein [Verrucomicrobiales bacterium]|tara:strand:- start:1150 stop:1428 length:279 start_codon:yes stop_codon:yes gene_type:complete
MSEPRIDLYIKPECPWCIAVVAWLKKNGYRYRQYDVISDEEKFDEMVEMTGQSFAPCMRLRTEGSVDKILSDFGVEELVDLIEELGLMPDDA